MLLWRKPGAEVMTVLGCLFPVEMEGVAEAWSAAGEVISFSTAITSESISLSNSSLDPGLSCLEEGPPNPHSWSSSELGEVGWGRGGGEKGDHRRKSRTTSLLRKTWRHAAVIILVPRPRQAFCHLQYRKAVFACGESMGMRLLQSLLQNLHHMFACPVLKGL